MASIKEREIFSFSEYSEEIVNSSKPLSYASDGQFSICCREVIYVCSLSCDLDIRSHSFSRNPPCKLSVQKIVNLSTLPYCSLAESVIDLPNSLPKISLLERQDLLIDTVLCPDTVFPMADLGGFRRAVFSSFCNSSHGLFIVAITFNHQIFVFELRSGEWTLYNDFTPILKRHLTVDVEMPVTLGEGGNMTLAQYKSLIHSMSCVEITWSSPFQGREGSSENSSDILLLFCGMRNGDLHSWEMKTCLGPMTTKDAFTFVQIDKYNSEVTSLSWYSMAANQGYVTVGYMNGNLRVLSVAQQSNLEFEIREQFKHEPNDDLSVSDVATMHLHDNLSILIAGKQFYLEIYRIHDNIFQHCKIIHIDCSLPLESFSINGKFGCASSQDGTIFHFQFHEEENDICVRYSAKSNMACLKPLKNTNWLCKGVALTPNGALCISIHRPMSDLAIKYTTHTRYLERQKLVLSLTPDFSDDDFVFPFTSSFPEPYVSTGDIALRLLLIIQNIFKSNQTLEFIEEMLNKLISNECMKNLQIAYAIYLFEYFKIHQTALQQQKLKFSGESKCRELGIKVLCKHISNCFHAAKKFEKNVFTDLPFMHQWLSDTEEKKLLLLQYMNSMELSSLEQAAKSNKYCCSLCEAELVTFTNLLEVKCSNGHLTRLCCLTFSPVEGPKFRHCLSCNTVAMDMDELEMMDVPFVMSRHMCTLCGGRLQ